MMKARLTHLAVVASLAVAAYGSCLGWFGFWDGPA
jgi:hypothetical protein